MVRPPRINECPRTTKDDAMILEWEITERKTKRNILYRIATYNS